MNRSSKRILAVGMPLATIAATGVAFAAWTATGGGVGGATASNATDALTVTAAYPAADLYPGLTANGTSTGGALKLHVVNDRPYPVQFTTVTPGGTGTYSAPAGCDDGAGGNAVSMPAAITIAAVTVPTGAAGVTITVPNALSMASGATDACQDGTFDIPVTVG